MSMRERWYPEVAFGGFSSVDGTVAFYSRVVALVRENYVVLDFGCGRGAQCGDDVKFRRDLRSLRGRAARVIGVDVDEVGFSNEFIDEFRLLKGNSPWPIDTESIDLLVSDCVVEHLSDPEQFFREARRVLRPEGLLCIRTPNSWGYVALVARMMPEKIHGTILRMAQPLRRSEDVFPTFYRCNNVFCLRKILARTGFSGVVMGFEAEPAYLNFSRLVYALGVVAHRWMPRMLCSSIFVFCRKHRDD